jgi:uncharacterized protein
MSLNESIAVVGSGMAGLAAAYRCRQAGHDVTVFEAQSGLGMDAHTLALHGGRVDMPLRVMSPGHWHSVLELATEVGIPTYAVDTNVSCSNIDQRTWFRSTRMPLTGWQFGSMRSLNLKAVRIGLGMLQLSASVRGLRQLPAEVTLDEVLRDQHFDPLFWRGLVLPLLVTICTCDEEHLLAWPAAQLLSLLHMLIHGEPLLRLQGGTSALVTALAKGLHCHGGSRVSHVVERGQQVQVENSRGEGGLFDRVIIATQANQLDFLHDASFARERDRLQAVHYARGELLLHTDERFMPRDRRDWAALNFQSTPTFDRTMFTVWVNSIEPTLTDARPLFQSWNPIFAPDEGKVLSRVPLQRAVVHAGTAAVLDEVKQWHRQPGRKVFYCGSWAHPGVPLLETAVLSAQSVVEIIRQQPRAG